MLDINSKLVDVSIFNLEHSSNQTYIFNEKNMIPINS